MSISISPHLFPYLPIQFTVQQYDKFINNSMKSYGLVIDQALQPAKPFQNLQAKQQTSSAVFPKKINFDSNTQSYSTVVEQAVITKDKPLLKEIIADADQKTLKNTLGEINIDKISSLLGLLQEFLFEDSQHTDQYCSWLRELLRQHLGVILSNPDNKSVVSRLLKFVQRKTSERASVLTLRNNLRTQALPQKTKQFQAKFNYIQNQEVNRQEQEVNMGIEEEDFQDMLEEFDE